MRLPTVVDQRRALLDMVFLSLADALAVLRLHESMATTAHTLSLERPFLRFVSSSRSTLVLKNYISPIHTRPERITRFFQPLTAQKILWR